MAERKTGLGTLPTGLLRPTTPKPPEPDAEVDENDQADDANNGEDQGRGGAQASRPTRRRTRRPPVSGESKGRKIGLPDEIHDRLKLLAFQRRTTVSAVATDLLDKALPRFRLDRDG